MRELKIGSRLQSAVCDAQIIVIKGSAGQHAITCGGAPMLGVGEQGSGVLDPAQAEGVQTGKRYVNADESVEVLCVKGGQGDVAVDGAKLTSKQAKALPSSD